MILHRTTLETPAGTLELYARDGRLCALGFVEGRARRVRRLGRRFGDVEVQDVAPSAAALAGASARIRAYLSGDLAALSGLALDEGGTPFQRKVWRALRGIPAGRTVSYRQIATRVGAPSAVRAVGTANGANPIAIATPCHRVIGSDGKLHGYAGGLARKRWLLEHEGAAVSG